MGTHPQRLKSNLQILSKYSKGLKSKRFLPERRSKTDLCPSGSDLRPETRSDITLRGDTGREPSWVCKCYGLLQKIIVFYFISFFFQFYDVFRMELIATKI